MKFNIFKRCKHNWSIVHHIGGDIQNTAYECDKCNKHKAVSCGSTGKFKRIKKYTKLFACFRNYAYLCKRNQKWFSREVVSMVTGIRRNLEVFGLFYTFSLVRYSRQ